MNKSEARARLLELRDVLNENIRRYYVEGESEYEIANDIDMSRQWVNRRRNQVLDELTMPKRKRVNSQILLN